MSIIGDALKSLASMFWSPYHLRTLSSGDDLNDFKTIGIYCNGDTVATRAMLNIPASNVEAGYLVVSNLLGTARIGDDYSNPPFWRAITQTWMDYRGRMFVRTLIFNGSNWEYGSWDEYISSRTRPIEITPTRTSYCSSLGAYTYVGQIARIVTCNFNICLANTPGSGAEILTGLPVPVKSVALSLVGDNGTCRRAYIATNGSLRLDGLAGENRYYNGSASYISAS